MARFLAQKTEQSSGLEGWAVAVRELEGRLIARGKKGPRIG
jgi:hypothetical protein